MANLLNYKYEIFPTRPQRRHLGRILREARIQWNKAVTIRKKLKASLRSSQIEHVLKACLSAEKKNWQANRKKAIKKFQEERPALASLDFPSVAQLYDLQNLVGKVLAVNASHLDLSWFAQELKQKYDEELYPTEQ